MKRGKLGSYHEGASARRKILSYITLEMFPQGHHNAVLIEADKILLYILTDLTLRVFFEVIHSFIHSGIVLDIGNGAVNKMDQAAAFREFTLHTSQGNCVDYRQ